MFGWCTIGDHDQGYKPAVHAASTVVWNKLCFRNKKSIQSLDTAQGNFLKAATGINKSCHITYLLDGNIGLKIHKYISTFESRSWVY